MRTYSIIENTSTKRIELSVKLYIYDQVIVNIKIDSMYSFIIEKPFYYGRCIDRRKLQLLSHQTLASV